MSIEKKISKMPIPVAQANQGPQTQSAILNYSSQLYERFKGQNGSATQLDQLETNIDI
jgi:hypothetical protein